MPEIKHYDGKKKQSSKPHAKRRPHREVETDTMDEADAINTEAQNEGLSSEKHSAEAEQIMAEAEMIAEGAPSFGEEPSEQHQEKVHLEFYGSDLIREKAPKVMELADTVAEEWVHDGKFEGLPVGNPLAQVVAAKALRKAKDVEKKLEEKGVFLIAKMGVDYVKAEINKRKK